MITNPWLKSRLGICSGSLHPESVDALIAGLREVELARVQLWLEPIRIGDPAWKNTPAKLKDAGIAIDSAVGGCVGEDYTTIESIRRTGGVVPDDTWPQTRENMKGYAAATAEVGTNLCTFHAGFIPDDVNDPIFKKVVSRIKECRDIFRSHGVKIALETGQEKATALKKFLTALDTDDVGVNFDPANMILYSSGDPIEALKLLLPHVKQCHIKDAIASPKPGEWGRETPIGDGQVDWKKFFEVLHAGKWNGPLMIEREGGAQRVADIKSAQQVLDRSV